MIDRYPQARVSSFPGLGLTSREQLMSSECSAHQVLSFANMVVVCWTNKKYSVLISVLQSTQWINSERIYPQNRVSSFPGLISISIYITITIECQKVLDKSNCKLTKINEPITINQWNIVNTQIFRVLFKTEWRKFCCFWTKYRLELCRTKYL